jgi:hypothetical protein
MQFCEDAILPLSFGSIEVAEVDNPERDSSIFTTHGAWGKGEWIAKIESGGTYQELVAQLQISEEVTEHERFSNPPSLDDPSSMLGIPKEGR